MEKLQDYLLNIDSNKVRQYVNKIKKNNPQLHRQELAKKIIGRQAFENGLLGAGTGALGLVALPVTLPTDMVKLLRAEGFLFKCVNYIYGIDPDDDSINYLFPLLVSANSQKDFEEDVGDAFETFWGDSEPHDFLKIFLLDSAKKAVIKQFPNTAAKLAVRQFGKGVANYTLKGIPKHLAKIFWRVGGRKFTERAAAKALGKALGKAIPVLGAASGFAMDWYSVKKKGSLAIKFHEEGVISWACSLFTMQQPTITKIADSHSSSDSLIFIHGYLTRDSNSENNRAKWTNKLRSSGWKGSIYHCWWDSSNTVNMVLDAGGDFFLNGKFPTSHFQKYRKISALIGSHFIPEYVSKAIPSGKIVFIGHSLGAISAFNSMKVWHQGLPQLKHIILLGGAMDCNIQSWGQYSRQVCGQVINVYNPSDSVLNVFYKLIHHDQTPCGLAPITSHTQNIVNIDSSQYVKESHLCHSYLDFFLKGLTPNRKNFW